MFFTVRNPAAHRHAIRCWISGGLVALFAVFAMAVSRVWHPQGPFAYLLAVLPALPIPLALIATGVYLSGEKDEFQRNLLVQSLLGGTGGVLVGVTTWGYLEDFAQAPHLNLVWIYPFFWLFAAISNWVVAWRYR